MMKKTTALLLLTAMLLMFCIQPCSAAQRVKYTSLFEEASVMEIDFRVDEDLWQQMMDHAMEKQVICCNAVVDGETYYSVGVNCKGNSSLAAAENGRYSLRVTFDEYVHQQSLWGLDKILLNNMTCDPTYIKEYLSYKLFEAMGVPAPLCRFVHVTVNGNDYALMLAVEAVEDDFEARSFGTEEGQLYKVETMDMNGRALRSFIISQERQRRGVGQGFWEDFSDRSRPTVPAETPDPAAGDGTGGAGGTDGGIRPNGADLKYVDGREQSYSAIFNGAEAPYTTVDAARLIECIRVLNEGTDEEIAECFDVEEILRYFAVNTFLVNTDHYTGGNLHNYYIYEYRGKVSILPWDYNLSFGAFLSSDASGFVNFPIDTPVDGAEMEDRPLISRLLANETWRNMYHGFLEQVLSFVEGGAFEDRTDQIRTLLSPYVAAETNPFYSYDAFEEAVDELTELVKLRIESVRGQLDGTIPSTRQGQGGAPELLVDCTGRDLSAAGRWQAGAETVFPEELGAPATPGPFAGAAEQGTGYSPGTPAGDDGAAGRPGGPAASDAGGNDGKLLADAALIVALAAVLVLTGFLLRRKR